MATSLTKDFTPKQKVVKIQMEQKISVEEWNSATEVEDRLCFKCEIGGAGNINVHIYPKGRTSSEEPSDAVCVYVSTDTPEYISTSLLWPGKFQKTGDDNGPVKLHDNKTWKIRDGPHPENLDKEYGGEILDAADIPEHTINGCLVFKAEIQVSFSPTISFTHVEDRFFDQNLEKHAFFDNLIKKFGDADSDFTVKSSEGNKILCHKLILSAN